MLKTLSATSAETLTRTLNGLVQGRRNLSQGIAVGPTASGLYKHPVAGLTLNFSTPVATVTFVGDLDLKQIVAAINSQVGAVVAHLYQLERSGTFVLALWDDATPVTLLHTGTANSYFGFSTTADDASLVQSPVDSDNIKSIRADNTGGYTCVFDAQATPFLDLTKGDFSRPLAAFGQVGASTDGLIAFLRLFDVDERRIEDRGDGFGRCLLMEKESTNRLLFSRDITNAVGWALPGAAAVTGNAGTSPDGTTSADRVVATGSTFSPGQSLTGLLANPHTLSAYGRAFSGTTDWETNYGPFPYTAWSGVITTIWVRKRETKATTGGNLYAEDGTLAGGPPLATAGDVLVDLWQAEDGPYATSPIPTNGAPATRPPDRFSHADGTYPPGFLTVGFDSPLVFGASSAELDESGETWVIAGSASGDTLHVIGVGGGACQFVLRTGGVDEVVAGPCTWSAAQAITVMTRIGAGEIEILGATTGNGTYTGGTGTAWASGNRFYVGGDSAGANNVGELRFIGVKIVQTAATPLPANSVAPILSGVVKTGNSLTITPGTWTRTPRLTYELLMGSSTRVGPGATQAEVEAYVLVVGDSYLPFTLIETAVVGATSVTSNALGYLYATPTGVTLKGQYDGSHFHLTLAGRIDKWLDQGGLGNELEQTDPGNMPVPAPGAGPNGLDAIDFSTFAGAATFVLKASLGLGPQVTVFTLVQTPGPNRYVHDGNVVDSRVLFYLAAGNAYNIYNGHVVLPILETTGDWVVDAAVFDGATSKHALDAGPIGTADAGGNNDAGFSYGRGDGGASNCLNSLASIAVVYVGAMSDADQIDVRYYMMGLGLLLGAEPPPVAGFTVWAPPEGISTSGGSVDSITNFGTSKTPFTATGSARPGTTVIDGKTVPLYDGVDDVMVGPPTSTTIQANAWTMAVVFRPDALGTAYGSYENAVQVICDDSGYWGPSAVTTDGVASGFYAGADKQTDPAPVSAGDVYIMFCVYDGAVLKTTINGVTHVRAVAASVGYTGGHTQIGYMGRTLYLQGAVCEPIVYDRALTNAELDATQAYLLQRWPSAVVARPVAPPVAGFTLWTPPEALSVAAGVVDFQGNLGSAGGAFSALGGFSTTTIDGHVVSLLDGVDDTLSGGPAAVYVIDPAGLAWSMWWVVRADALIGAVGPIYDGAQMLSDIGGNFSPLVFDANGVRTGFNSLATAPIPISTGVLYLARVTYDGATLSLTINGVTETLSTSASVSGLGFALAQRMGENYNGSAFFTGVICESVGYPTYLSPPNQALIDAYFRAKYPSVV
jgi:hypothetical protein